MTLPLTDAPVRGAAPSPRTGARPRLTAALTAVTVAPDAREATVAGRTVTADSPRDLRGRLTNALYEELHAGRHHAALPDGPPPRRTLRDPALERRLASAVPHATTPPGAGSSRWTGGPTATGSSSASRRSPPASPPTGCSPRPSRPSPARTSNSPWRPPGPRCPRLLLRHGLPPAAPPRRGRTAAVPARAGRGRGRRAVGRGPRRAGGGRGPLPRQGALRPAGLPAPGRDRRLPARRPPARRTGGRRRGRPVRRHPDRPTTSVFTEELAPGVAAAWDPRDPRPGRTA